MAEITSVKFESSVPIKMRDGTTLLCDIFRPEAPGEFPALLERTPYDRTSPFARSVSLDAVRACLDGYAVLVQD